MIEALDLDGLLFEPRKASESPHAPRRLAIWPAEFYDQFRPEVLRAWLYLNAVYCIPTRELVDYLLDHVIMGRSAIEIGSGNGALGRALGIPRTDSRMQEDLRIQAFYRAGGQPTVTYGEDVERLDALAAVEKYQPEVVIGAWVTHWVDPERLAPDGGGNMFGIREDVILQSPSVRTYAVVGADSSHRHKPILKLPHVEIREPWIRSRARDGSDAIFIWQTGPTEQPREGGA